MNKSIVSILFLLVGTLTIFAQTTQPATPITTQPAQDISKIMQDAPYHNIGEYPSSFNSAAMVQRTIDGLGYRYHWATKGLTAEDLAYAPGNEGQTCQKVIEHLYGLSLTIRNTIEGKPNIRPYPALDMNFEQLRTNTLKHFKAASDHLAGNPDLDLEKLEVVFVRGEKRSAFPFWHILNGPILDAVYHTGQIVSYRRTTGNPVHPKVNVFTGKGPE